MERTQEHDRDVEQILTKAMKLYGLVAAKIPNGVAGLGYSRTL